MHVCGRDAPSQQQHSEMHLTWQQNWLLLLRFLQRLQTASRGRCTTTHPPAQVDSLFLFLPLKPVTSWIIIVFLTLSWFLPLKQALLSTCHLDETPPGVWPFTLQPPPSPSPPPWCSGSLRPPRTGHQYTHNHPHSCKFISTATALGKRKDTTWNRVSLSVMSEINVLVLFY